ncbi:hypothetical protein HK104_011358, partial [Borealophlyctis nickersoniae]
MFIDGFVQGVLNAGDNYDKLTGKVVPLIKGTPTGNFTGILSDGRDPLQVLQADQHSLGYLAILVARMSVETANPAVLLPFAMTFAERFSPGQVSLLPFLMTQFGNLVGKLAERGPTLLSAVRPLVVACRRWSVGAGSGVHLTSLHSIATKYCLLAKHPRAALQILEQDIAEIEPRGYDLRYQEFLLYHYYGGMIYTGRKQFERALDFFSLCVSAPASVVSAIQVEAYRKYVLVSLLVDGKVRPLPKYTSAPVTRSFRSFCAPYQEFAQAYESLNVIRVQTEYGKHSDAFNKHRNLGLARQCLEALVRRNIQQLTQTYLTLSLADIAKTVGLDSAAEAERHLLRMIDEGQIYATIGHREGGMVSFHDAPDRFDDTATMNRMNAEIKKAGEVAGRVTAMDRQIGLAKAYLSKMMQAERGGG